MSAALEIYEDSGIIDNLVNSEAFADDMSIEKEAMMGTKYLKNLSTDTGKTIKGTVSRFNQRRAARALKRESKKYTKYTGKVDSDYRNTTRSEGMVPNSKLNTQKRKTNKRMKKMDKKSERNVLIATGIGATGASAGTYEYLKDKERKKAMANEKVASIGHSSIDKEANVFKGLRTAYKGVKNLFRAPKVPANKMFHTGAPRGSVPAGKLSPQAGRQYTVLEQNQRAGVAHTAKMRGRAQNPVVPKVKKPKKPKGMLDNLLTPNAAGTGIAMNAKNVGKLGVGGLAGTQAYDALGHSNNRRIINNYQ